MILSRGNTLDYAEMYRAWAGHDPSIEPYLEYYGLGGSDATATAPK
jgi:peptidyl-dipeptidase Dcp